MRWALIGPGAVGGLYGGLLAVAGEEVHALYRRDAAPVRAGGVHLRSPLHDGPVPVVVHDTVATIPPVDAVLVATKTTANAELAPVLGPLVGGDTIVVVLQNGLGVEAEVAAATGGRGRFVGGLCFVCANRTGPGRTVHLDYGDLTLAAHTGVGSPSGCAEAVETVASAFAATGIGVHVADDLVAARWRKLVWNVPFNGLSVVLDAATDALVADPSVRSLVVELMGEVAAGAAAVGRPVPRGFAERMLTMTEAMIPYATSMKLDHDAGRPLEVGAIYDAPVAAAAAAGCAMPRTAALAAQLRFLDRRAQAAP
jgi:2-dehydropantoate 2-reductase